MAPSVTATMSLPFVLAYLSCVAFSAVVMFVTFQSHNSCDPKLRLTGGHIGFTLILFSLFPPVGLAIYLCLLYLYKTECDKAEGKEK